MRKYLFLALLSLTACGDSDKTNSNVAPAAPAKPVLRAPFKSTVDGVSIRNTHLVAQGEGNSFIMRGMAPLSLEDVNELTNVGVNEIIIFRNDVAGETGITDELKLISANGKVRATHLIPFKWKEIPDFKSACQDTIKALTLLKTALQTAKTGLFFHCTVGEDRTGYLSGLYRILFQNMPAQMAFETEMCAHGYAEGDPGKPGFVVDDVHKNITVLYLKMLLLIERKELAGDKLDLNVCESDPGDNIEFKEKLTVRMAQHKCKPQKTHF